MRDTTLYQPFLLAIPFLLLYKPKLAIQILIGLVVVFFFTFRFTVLAQAGPISIHNIDVAAGSLFVFLLYVLLKHEHIPFMHSTFWFLLLFGWGLLGVVRGFTEWGLSAIHGARIEVVPMIIFFGILVIMRSESDVVETIRRFSFVVFVGIILNYVVFYYFGGNANSVFYNFDVRQASRFLIAEEALPVAFLFVGLIYGIISGNIKLNLPIAISALAILLMAILATQHRSVWAATLVGLGIVWIRMLSHHRAFLLITTMVMSTVLLVVILVLLSLNGLLGSEIRSFAEVNLAFLSGVQNDDTGSWRVAIWQQYLAETYKSPIWGHGFGPELLIDFGNYKKRIQAHNAYVTYFYETGIVGMMILFTAFTHWLMELQYYIKTEPNPINRLIAISLQSSAIMTIVFGFFYRQHILIWIILGLGSVLVYTRHQVKQTPVFPYPAEPYQSAGVQG